ncbi:hypothetical protein TVAG_167140 [Trichomonas vaginalis G3]|uniref:Uncharacterized protein n=1 Tax=Trichomonas vaginalis (strain ATCC PRA-98 / G3) TaxID=412133 RepID=A2DEC1_TRIV3|nr:thioredoxin-like domain family [Trichomonas vaginalis G3]EAY21339.1 hypothetical protein TVAG_167140 [Trichomonas vaginalis G3]KAI5548924.1 thioredoxin-like domain family [Trichomonas vaginalis G3]|eukprot:XP_001582325.1 hypothetical protein [Trichomonas vaginalis G3]
MNQTTDRAVGFSVECSEQFELCNDLNAQYFPSIIAMRSVYSFYHRLYHGNFTPSSLITFVETVIDPPIQYLDSLGSIDLLSDGFMNVTVPVYFGPNAKPKGEEFIPFLTNLSNFIYAANRTFATYYDSSEHMKIYISPNCGLLYNGPMNQKSILKFMEDYKYPILHKFTYEQFSTYHPDVPMLAILSTRPLSEEYASILSDVSSKLCGKFIFGWLDPFSDRRYNITFKNDPEDPTLFAYVDRTNHKIFKLLKRPDTQIVHQFVLNVTHFYEQGEDWDNGWAIFGAFILLILTSIFLLVYNSTYQKCISNINELFF